MEEVGDKQINKDLEKTKSPKLKGKNNYGSDKKTLEDFMKLQAKKIN
jgi:hypothetical protein